MLVIIIIVIIYCQAQGDEVTATESEHHVGRVNVGT